VALDAVDHQQEVVAAAALIVGRHGDRSEKLSVWKLT
jgi:hypothetical protein